MNYGSIRLTKLWICGALTLAFCVTGLGQQPAPAANDKSATEALVQRMEALQNELNQIKEQIAKITANASTAQPPTVAAAPAPESAPKPIEPLAEIQNTDDHASSHKLGAFQMRGFADLSYGRPMFEQMPNGILNGSTNSFRLGDFDLLTTAKLSDKFSFLGELLVTTDFSNEFEVELDRMLLTYKANDYFKISLGRFNTAIGYYSNGFQRARFFQTTPGRPLMFTDEDDGGILPVHNIGLTASGKVPSGALGLHWTSEVANGRSSAALSDTGGGVVDVQNFFDENNGKAVNFALMISPPALHGFQAGVSYYRDRLHPTGLPEMSDHTPSAHIVFVRPNFEFLNEAAMVRHADVIGGHVWNSLTGYTQLSRKFGSYRPYFRYDYQHVPKTDPVFGHFGQVGSANGPSLGVRYDFADYAAIKFGYGRLLQPGLPWTSDYQVQVAFAF